MAGPVFWRMEDSPRVLRFYRDWIAEAPDELMTIVIHRKAPPLDFVPPELHGELVVAIVACYAGPVEDGERVLRPLKQFGSPVLDLCEPKPYLEHQGMFDPSYPHGRWYYMRACDVAELSDEVIDITVEHAMRIRSPRHRVPDLADGRRGGARARRRHRVHEPRRGPHVQPDQRDRGARGLRRGAPVDARLLGGARAPPDGRLRELPDGRGRGPRARGLRPGEVRPAKGAEAGRTTRTTCSGSTRTSRPKTTGRSPARSRSSSFFMRDRPGMSRSRASSYSSSRVIVSSGRSETTLSALGPNAHGAG